MSDEDTRAQTEGAGNAKRRTPSFLKYLVLFVLILVAVVVWFFLRAPVPEAQPEPVLPVNTIRATVGNLDRSITLDSYVGSDSVVTVLPKVSGTLIALNADVGTLLKAGEVVAKIDPEPYQIALNQAKAVYDGAASVYDRQKQLFAGGATSQANYDQAKTQYENARSQYELAKLHLSYTTIVSPVDGTVIRRHVSNGALVSQSVPIVTVSNTHALVVKVNVPETYARTFEDNRAAMPISASIPAMGSERYRLRIRNIAPAIDVTTKTFSVECEIEGNTDGILPGMFAQVSFVLERRREVPMLPYGVLVGGDTLWYVAANGTAEYFEFTPSYHNDEYFQIPEKYEGYVFILAGQHFLSAGSPVKASNSTQVLK